MDDLTDKITRAKLAAEGCDEPNEDFLAGSEQHAKNFIAMVEAWFAHRFGAAESMKPAPAADPKAVEGDAK